MATKTKAAKKLTADQAAKQLKVSTRTVRRTMRSLGLGTGGGRYEITPSQLKQLREAV